MQREQAPHAQIWVAAHKYSLNGTLLGTREATQNTQHTYDADSVVAANLLDTCATFVHKKHARFPLSIENLKRGMIDHAGSRGCPLNVTVTVRRTEGSSKEAIVYPWSDSILSHQECPLRCDTQFDRRATVGKVTPTEQTYYEPMFLCFVFLSIFLYQMSRVHLHVLLSRYFYWWVVFFLVSRT